MENEVREICFDHELGIEAYRFEGIMQKFPSHFHEYYVLGFIERGHRKLSCKGQEYIIGTGDLIFFNPFDIHACEAINHEELDYRCLNIESDVMRRAMYHLTGEYCLPYFMSPVFKHADHAGLLHELHHLIMDKENKAGKVDKFHRMLHELITNYAKVINESDVVKSEVGIEEICQYVNENYKRPLSLDELSATFGMNKFTLLRVFSKYKGITPYKYLQTVRVNEAKKRLEQGERPIDVALETGFVDQSHLHKSFIDFIGFTPGQYKAINHA